MATKTTFPIPQDKIQESFVWRDWFQKLSDRAFGTASTLDIPIEPEYGGTGLTTYNTGDIIYSNSTNNLTKLPAPASTSLLQMTAAGVPSWTASSAIVTSVTGTSPVASSGGTTPAISLAAAYGDTLNPYASKTANYFLAAPNGSAGVPTFRAIVVADVTGLGTMATQNTGVSATVALAKLTGAGTNGSLTVVSGVVTAYTAPT